MADPYTAGHAANKPKSQLTTVSCGKNSKISAYYIKWICPQRIDIIEAVFRGIGDMLNVSEVSLNVDCRGHVNNLGTSQGAEQSACL